MPLQNLATSPALIAVRTVRICGEFGCLYVLDSHSTSFALILDSVSLACVRVCHVLSCHTSLITSHYNLDLVSEPYHMTRNVLKLAGFS